MNSSVSSKYDKLIAGPCGAESEEQVMATARELCALGVKRFRAGLWKPRTHYGCFEGVGEIGLPWLNRVQEETGMKVMTEVATPKQAEKAIEAKLDMLWIGARTTVNPFMMNDLCAVLKGTDIPVYVKNPICPDLGLWIGSLERLDHAGVKDITAIHRGFMLYDNGKYRNSTIWDIVAEFKEQCPQIPIYSDPSHVAGKREYIREICEQAIEAGIDHFFIESHINPPVALSDSKQQLTPAQLDELIKGLDF